MVKELTRVVLQQLHRNRTFGVWATTERPGQFSGRPKVARRSQSCVKGALPKMLKLLKANFIIQQQQKIFDSISEGANYHLFLPYSVDFI